MPDLAAGIEKGGVVDEQREPTTSEDEDVEAHRSPVERAPVERPVEELGANSEEPEVEGHLLDRPVEKPVE
jgi:hypothetical protein